VLTEPCSECLGLAVWQELHDRVALEIDEDGAVAMPSPPGPVIYAQHPRCRLRRFGCGYARHQAEHRVGAGWDSQTRCQLCCGLTAECNPT